ncbi:3-oxoacyl-ACP reductase [Nocardia nova]|uniref:3-oxoacyl-[acyl-carrier-protein] reductase MabA n=1 Tax=Nocardia nova TaxID=37330 RepID=A0A2S6AMY8_9NOCA|nr:SDR family oxidoreductase [Nocardia nova]PPJ36617.1 3-oxoacyl-ACP reductase [Nocardia nova]
MATVFDKFDLTDRIAIVTGAGNGIGAAIATVLAEAGAHVAVADIAAAAAEATARQIVDRGFSAEPAELDVRVQADVDGLVSDTVRTRGRLDIFVNNAGIIADQSPLTVSAEELDRVHAVNFKGLVFGSQAAARVMIDRGSGSIVNITSAGIDGPTPALAAYTTAKAAAHQFTRSLALEIAPRGVRVNAVAPGWVETPMTRRHVDTGNEASSSEALRSSRAAAAPLGLAGDPRDPAYAVLYLVADAARFVTGAVMRPNGGMSMLW